MNTKKHLYTLFTFLMILLVLLGPSTIIAVKASVPPLYIQQETPTTTPAVGPDSFADAPPSSPDPSTPLQAGETIVTYSLPWVSFRVEDGYDLDQYLFMSDSPIDFYIDMQGFEVNSDQPTQVTLRAWDVDQQGVPGYPQCQLEVDKVDLNGIYLGNLTGADSQWSIVTFNVPSNMLNPYSNHFRVFIDTLNTGCWAVEIDWAELRVPFNIAMIETSATDDVIIRRGTTDDVITDPIWEAEFNADGNVIVPTDPPDPIADKIRDSREFDYRYQIGHWPYDAWPSWDPRVEYEWEIQGTNFRSNGEQTGWVNDFTVTLPSEVGAYTLAVVLDIYYENELLRTEQFTHQLYVLWNWPINTTIGEAATLFPRTAWLDVATSWANGQSTEVGILGALNSSEYNEGNNPLGWGYGYPSFDPTTLIENGAGKNGDCYDFRDVWRILAAILGISTGEERYAYDAGPQHFMTKLRPALDGNASANAVPAGTDPPGLRWFFSSHALGTYEGTFYDPTFGLIGTDQESNIFCWAYFPRPTSSCFDSGLSKVAALTDTAQTYNGWPVITYTLAVPTPYPPGPPPQLAAAAGFTGNASDSGYDADNNGLSEHLQADIELDVTEAGDFGILATLNAAGGETIALGSLVPDLDRAAPATQAALETGTQTISLYFNGRDIRTSGVDGSYTINVRLYDDQGALLDEGSFTTTAYNHLDFQGLLIEVQNLSDSGVDTDAIPGANLLRVEAQVNMLAASDVNVQGQLFAGNTHLVDIEEETISLSAGTHTLNLDFPGQAMSASALSGPYTLYLSFKDTYYINNQEYTTAAYNHTDFQLPNAFFTDNISDSGHDTNGNGLYDELSVAVQVEALTPGTYTLHGILQDGVGDFIEAAEETVALDTAPVELTLRFDGLRIGRHGVDGPYQVILVLTDASNNDLDSLYYDTSPYTHTDFEQADALFNGSFADSGVDTSSDGLYDLLRIDVGVEATDAGFYIIKGSLLDDNGNLITWAETELFLDIGTHTVSLDFDGRTIYTHGMDGPYRLIALNLRQPGIGVIDSILNAHTTAAYAYTEFQPSGLTPTGNFADHGEDTNGNGLYESLVVDMEVSVTQSGIYYFNARLVDANGEEIVWAVGSQYLTPGIHWVSLRFNGRYIYGNGIDGPYNVKDLSIYSYSQAFTLPDVWTTGGYGWSEFEPSGVVSGSVMAGGQPVANANIFISGVDSDLTNSNGVYRLTALNSGTYVINIDADSNLAPWQIWVNGQQVGVGTSAIIQVIVGQVTEVEFISTVGIPTPTPTVTPTPIPTPTPTPGPGLTQGRMTGGGSVFTTDDVRVTHGLTLHCDASEEPNNLQVEWGKGNKFHLESLNSAICSDAPNIGESPPAAGFDTYVGSGMGRYNGVSGAVIEWTFTDAGEPGDSDFANIVVKDVNGSIVLSVSGYLDKGNHKAHEK